MERDQRLSKQTLHLAFTARLAGLRFPENSRLRMSIGSRKPIERKAGASCWQTVSGETESIWKGHLRLPFKRLEYQHGAEVKLCILRAGGEWREVARGCTNQNLHWSRRVSLKMRMEEQHGKMTFDDITQDMASLDIELLKSDMIAAVQENDVSRLQRALDILPAIVNFSEDDGRRVLHIAAGIASVEIIHALLLEDPEIDHQDKEGNTALMVAAAFNRTDVVRVLLDQGADASIANKEGLTARQLAADFPETAEVLAAVEQASSAVEFDLAAANFPQGGDSAVIGALPDETYSSPGTKTAAETLPDSSLPHAKDKSTTGAGELPRGPATMDKLNMSGMPPAPALAICPSPPAPLTGAAAAKMPAPAPELPLCQSPPGNASDAAGAEKEGAEAESGDEGESFLFGSDRRDSTSSTLSVDSNDSCVSMGGSRYKGKQLKGRVTGIRPTRAFDLHAECKHKWVQAQAAFEAKLVADYRAAQEVAAKKARTRAVSQQKAPATAAAAQKPSAAPARNVGDAGGGAGKGPAPAAAAEKGKPPMAGQKTSAAPLPGPSGKPTATGDAKPAVKTKPVVAAAQKPSAAPVSSSGRGTSTGAVSNASGASGAGRGAAGRGGAIGRGAASGTVPSIPAATPAPAAEKKPAAKSAAPRDPR